MSRLHFLQNDYWCGCVVFERGFMNHTDHCGRATLLARQTVERLEREGHSSGDAKRMVTEVINAEEFAVMKGRHSFDKARFVERLRDLPD